MRHATLNRMSDTSKCSICANDSGIKERERESARASERASERESKRAREQESKRARERESERAREREREKERERGVFAREIVRELYWGQTFIFPDARTAKTSSFVLCGWCVYVGVCVRVCGRVCVCVHACVSACTHG